MDLVAALVLGVLQGIVEWLPISSEAVISLFMTQILGRQPIESVNAAVYLHTGTMLAAFVYFKDEFMDVLRDTPEYFQDAAQQKALPDYPIINFLIVSTLLTGVLGGFIYLFGLEYIPESPDVFSALIGLALLATGLMKLLGSESDRNYLSVDTGDSVFAGLLQGLAIIPGISRSGTTVFALFYRDFSSEDAFKLSFLMSVPAVLAAQIGMNIFSGFQISQTLLVASVISFVVGYFSVGLVLRIAERTEVAYLCFALAALSFVAVLI